MIVPRRCIRTVTHRGLYFACHINGPAALPIQYADSVIALTVTRLVWPAVTIDNQDSNKTNPVAQIPEHIKIRKSSLRELMDEQTCDPLCKQEPHLIAPRKEVYQECPENTRDEAQKRHVCTTVRKPSSQSNTGPNGHDLNRTINASQKCCLKSGETERRHYYLSLVCQGSLDIENSREERKEPRFGISERLYHSKYGLEFRQEMVGWENTHCSILKCLFSTPV